jgi:hypothetical protein
MATSGAQFELRVDQSRAWLTVPGLSPGEMGLSRVEALRPSSIVLYIQSEAHQDIAFHLRPVRDRPRGP